MTRITKFPVLALPSLLLLGLVQAQKSSRFSDSISSEDPTLEKIIGSWRAPSKNNKNPYWFPNDLTRDILPVCKKEKGGRGGEGRGI